MSLPTDEVVKIYTGGYEKDHWYSYFAHFGGVDNMFSSLAHGPHSARKRLLSNVYAKSTLQASHTLAAITKALLLDGLLPRIANSRSGRVEAYELFSAVTMDGVTSYIFGCKQGAKFLQDPLNRKDWLRGFKARQEYGFWYQEMPIVLATLSGIGLGHLLVPKWVDVASAEFRDWCLSMCDAAEVAIQSESITSPADEPVVYRQLRSALIKQKQLDSASPEALSDQVRLEIASELLDNLAAGFDTSGITLTYLAWELSRVQHAKVQKRLREDLLSLSPSFRSQTDIPDARTLDELPWLHAIVMETLRLHAAIPGNQPRVTPESATIGPPGNVYHGLPAGIRVQAQAYSLHRNPAVFPDPESWRPERWLDAEGQIDSGGEKSRWFWAFGSGGRMCVGSNLAMMQMKSIIAAIWSNYSSVIIDDAGMGHNGGYTAGPLGTKEGTFLLLQFTRLE